MPHMEGGVADVVMSDVSKAVGQGKVPNVAVDSASNDVEEECG